MVDIVSRVNEGANINNDVMKTKQRRATGPNAVGARRHVDDKSCEA